MRARPKRPREISKSQRRIDQYFVPVRADTTDECEYNSDALSYDSEEDWRRYTLWWEDIPYDEMRRRKWSCRVWCRKMQSAGVVMVSHGAMTTPTNS